MFGQKFFICKKCGNMAVLIKAKGVPMVCCCDRMTELVPDTVTGITEKHAPEVTIDGNTLSVQVGSTPHPMDDGHLIAFVYVATERGGQRKCLNPREEPKVTFSFVDDKPTAVYAYCNLHGLWKTDIK